MIRTQTSRFLIGAIAAAGVALTFSATPASAQYIIFTDRAAWNAAVAPNTITTETFSVARNTSGVLPSGVVFTKGSQSPSNINITSSGRLYDQAAQGNPNRFVQFGFTPAISAVGADFVVDAGTFTPPEFGLGVGITFTLRDAANSILVQEQITSNGFFGILSEFSIANLRLTAGTRTLSSTIVESYTMDNLSFARGTVLPTAVPEPGEYAVGGMFLAGLMGLMVRARRRTQTNLA